MSRPITDSTAYVGRYADGTSWPWWVLAPLMLLAVAWGLMGRKR